MMAAENVAYNPVERDEAEHQEQLAVMPAPSRVEPIAFGAAEGMRFPVPRSARVSSWRISALAVLLSIVVHGVAIAGVMWLRSGREIDVEGTPQVVDVEVLTLSEFETRIGGGAAPTQALPAPAAHEEPKAAEPIKKAVKEIEKVPEKAVKAAEKKPRPQPDEELSTKQVSREKKVEPPQDTSPTTSGDAQPSKGDSAPSAAAASAASGAARGSMAGPGSGDISRISYQDMVATRLARAKRYPERALRRHMTGEGRIRIVIAPDGEVTDFQLVSSTNSEILDAELSAMVERAAPFPPFPTDMTKSSLSVVVPVAFRLE